MTQAYKVCPDCGQASVLSASQCGRCGRPYQTTAPQAAPTQVFPAGSFSQPAGRGTKARLLLWSIPAALLLAIALTLVFTRRDPPEPGPTTIALQEKLRPYLGSEMRTIYQVAGTPSQVDRKQISGGTVFFCRYDCPDGAVIVTYSEGWERLESIKAQGVDVPVFFGGPLTHSSTETISGGP